MKPIFYTGYIILRSIQQVTKTMHKMQEQHLNILLENRQMHCSVYNDFTDQADVTVIYFITA